MRVKLEQAREKHKPFHPPLGGELHYPGIVVESENKEEQAILKEIWENRGRPVVLTRLRNKQIELIIAPTPPPEDISV